jgi:NAD(P)-dependent dehydrogenase (short-subunit alcohol dehydrogenase family)
MPSSPESTRPVAVITGASQGLGLALSRALSERGWTVIADARHADRLHDATDALSDAVAGDVANADHRDVLVRTAAVRGQVHLVVNNASTLGASPLPSLDDLDLDTWRRLFDVNVIAPMRLVHDPGGALAPGATVASSTRVTCAPRCTSTRSPMRTSRIASCRKRACRACSR